MVKKNVHKLKLSSLFSLLCCLSVLLLFVGCVIQTPPAAGEQVLPTVEGALVGVRMDGKVGVLLDEIPEKMRDRVALALIAKPQNFWNEPAKRQLRLTIYRLVFRDAF